MLVYFGSQATTGGIGFSIAHFDSVTGGVSQPKFLVAADGPSIFAIGPDNRHLYTTNFTGDGGVTPTGSIWPAGAGTDQSNFSNT